MKNIHVEVPESSQPPATWAGEEAAVWPLRDALLLHQRGLGTQQDLPLLPPGGPHFKHRRFAFVSCKCVYVFGGFWTNHQKRINEPLFCQPIINRLLYSPNPVIRICYLCVMTWSSKTVNCNSFLRIHKSAKTQWFLESIYGEVLVFSKLSGLHF